MIVTACKRRFSLGSVLIPMAGRCCRSRSADIITQLIENSSCYSVLPDPSLPKPWPSAGSHHDVGCGRVDDPRLLERLRREAAHRVMAMVPRGPLRCSRRSARMKVRWGDGGARAGGDCCPRGDPGGA